MEKDLSDCFNKLNINNKNCVICNKNYIINYDYQNNDVLCIICSNNYNTLMLEDNYDNTKIL